MGNVFMIVFELDFKEIFRSIFLFFFSQTVRCRWIFR